MENNSNIIMYITDDGQVKIEVLLENENVWLSQNLMTKLFDTSKQNISLHIKNVYEENELKESSTVKNYLTVQQEGKRSVKRETKYYNLEVIIAVGYIVKSIRGTEFRVWANNLIKQSTLL